MNPESMNSEIWGPHYWFVLHTITMNYPLHPNSVTKKKYYEFIQNLPLFLPDSKIGDYLLELLDKFPVSPYLDSRESFIKWMHFLHNQINERLDKPHVNFDDFLEKYQQNYRPQKEIEEEQFKHTEKLIFLCIIIFLTVFIIYFYKK